MSSFDLWTIPTDIKLSKLSPSFVKFYNTNHIPLVNFEALLPYLIDNPNLINYTESGEAVNFNLSNKDLKCIENFLIDRGYLEVVDSSKLKNTELKFQKTDKVITVEDATVFGSLCYNLIQNNSDSSKKFPTVLDIFKNDKFTSAHTSKYKEFISLGRDRNAIKSDEYSKIFTNVSKSKDSLGNGSVPFKNFKDNESLLKLTDVDKSTLGNLISDLSKKLPEVFTNDVVYDFNIIIKDGYGFNVYTKLNEVLDNVNDRSKISDEVQKIIDISLKSSDAYIFLNMQHVMDADVYESFSNKASGTEKNSLIKLQGQFVNSNNIVVNYILKLKELNKTIRKYKSDLKSIEKTEVNIPEVVDMAGDIPDSQNVIDFNDYTKNLSEKHNLEKEYRNLDVDIKDRSVHNYLVREINDNISKLREDVVKNLQEDLEKSTTIFNESKKYMQDLSNVLSSFNKERTAIEYRLKVGLRSLVINYNKFLTNNNKSISDISFEQFSEYLKSERNEESNIGLDSIFNTLNNEVNIILNKCKKYADDAEKLSQEFKEKYRNTSENAINPKDLASNNNVDVLLAGLKYLKSVDLDHPFGDDDRLEYLDINDILSNGYQESDKQGILNAIKNMAVKMNIIRVKTINNAKNKFSLKNEQIYNVLSELANMQKNPKVVERELDTNKDMTYDKTFENVDDIVKKWNLKKRTDNNVTDRLSDNKLQELIKKYESGDDEYRNSLAETYPELKSAIKERNYSKRIQLGSTYDLLKDDILYNKELDPSVVSELKEFMEIKVDPYLSKEYVNTNGLKTLQDNLNILQEKYNQKLLEQKNKNVKAENKFDMFYKKIKASADFTVDEFDSIFQNFENERIQNTVNPLGNYYVSYLTTICKQLQSYFMLEDKNLTEKSIKAVVDKFISAAEKNPKLIDTLPFETTLEFLTAKRVEIAEQIAYIISKNFDANLKSVGTLTTLGKEIVTFNNNLNLKFEDSSLSGNTYTISGVYSPENCIEFLKNLNIKDPKVIQNVVNKCTLFVAENLYLLFISDIANKFGVDSLYYKSLTLISEDLVYETLNLLKAVVVNDENNDVIVSAKDSGFTDDILLPAFQDYLSKIPQNNIRTPEKCLASVENSGKYSNDSDILKYQYANFYVVNYIKNIILDFYKALPNLQYLFTLKSGNVTYKTTKKDLEDMFACDRLLFESLKFLGLYAPTGVKEVSDISKLIFLYEHFTTDPNKKRYGGYAKITQTGPFAAWERILSTVSQSYKRTTLLYVKTVLNDIGCNKKYLEKVNTYVLGELNMSQNDKDTFNELMNVLRNDSDKFDASEKIIQTDISNLENFAGNIINHDKILSNYVHFDLDSFNLDLCTFKYQIDYRKIKENGKANSFKNEEEINKIQSTMKNIVRALKSIESDKVSDLLNTAETFYKRTLVSVPNNNVTEAMVEERLLQFNKSLMNYVAQLNQDFNKFKEICKSMLDTLKAYTAKFIEVIDREENEQQKSLLSF